MSHFLDTNILIYSVSPAPAEASKRNRALELLDHGDGALSVQVLQEFYTQVTRANRPGAMSHKLAAGFVEKWSRFRVQDMTLAVFRDALRIQQTHGFSYWDSAIAAAALALGCDILYTEDLSHGQVIEGLTIINPFREIP